MNDHVTPPLADAAHGRRVLAVRVAILVAVALAVGLGVAGYVSAAPAPFSVDEPRPGQVAPAGTAVRASGSAGEAENGSLWVLAESAGSGGATLYTIGGFAPIVDGRWSGEVVVPDGGRADAPVSVVVVGADATCRRQLAEMGAPDQGAGRFYGPLPGGCRPLATVPLRP